MTGAWIVRWTESEAGWGQRPDGCWYYPSEQVAKDETAKELARQRKWEKEYYGGRTPSEYSFPGEPEFVPVSTELAEEIERTGRVYRQYPEKHS